MFQTDYSSNVGYMKQFDYINNSNINHYQSIAAFNPKDSTKEKFKIFDIEKNNGYLNKKYINKIIDEYESVIQNLRLIKRSAENRWSQQSKKWSEVALGEDSNGNILLIFSPSAYSMHDLNNILLELPIDIMCAQHLEGGAEASLYLKYKDLTIRNIMNLQIIPKELIIIIRNYVIFMPENEDVLKNAIHEWCIDKKLAKSKYGDISLIVLNICSWDSPTAKPPNA